MTAIAEPNYIQINSNAFVRGWTPDGQPIWGPPEYYVWRSDVQGLGKLLWVGASRDVALDVALTFAASDSLIIYEKPHKVPAVVVRWTVH
jgi:hypothetical protein